MKNWVAVVIAFWIHVPEVLVAESLLSRLVATRSFQVVPRVQNATDLQFSTYSATSLTVHVNGILHSHALRVINQDSSCSEANLSLSLDSGINVDCPGSCHAVSAEPSSASEIQLFSVGGDSIGCDSFWMNCVSSHLLNITFLNASHAIFAFDSVVDDPILIGDRIILDPTELVCSSLSVCDSISGLSFANALGNIVEALVSDTAIVVRLGESVSSPILQSVAIPTPTSAWEVVNRGSTRSEVTRFSEALHLRVCVGPDEVGRISFTDPPSIEEVTISAVSPIIGMYVPAILSVRGLHVKSSYRLRLVIVNPDHLDVSSPSTTGVVSCFSIIQDVLSPDLPAPIGCYLTTYVRRKDFTIEWTKGTQIPSTIQLLISVRVSQAVTAGSSEWIQVHAFGDNSDRMEEMGRAVVTGTPQSPGGPSTSHFLNPGGFQVNAVSGSTFSAILTGPLLAQSAIRQGVRLRIAVPGWKGLLAPRKILCAPTAGTYITSPESYCKSAWEEAEITSETDTPAFSFVYEGSPVFGQVRLNFTLVGLEVPAEGLWPTRVLAQVSAPDGSGPDVIWSSGDLLRFAPRAGNVIGQFWDEYVLQLGASGTVEVSINTPWLLKGGGKSLPGSLIEIFGPDNFLLTSGVLVTGPAMNITGTCSRYTCKFPLKLDNSLLFSAKAVLHVTALHASGSGMWRVGIGRKGEGNELTMLPEPEPFVNIARVSVISKLEDGKIEIDQNISGPTAWIWFKTGSSLDVTRMGLEIRSAVKFKPACIDFPIQQFYDSVHAQINRLPCDSMRMDSMKGVMTIALAHALLPSTRYLFGLPFEVSAHEPLSANLRILNQQMLPIEGFDSPLEITRWVLDYSCRVSQKTIPSPVAINSSVDLEFVLDSGGTVDSVSFVLPSGFEFADGSFNRSLAVAYRSHTFSLSVSATRYDFSRHARMRAVCYSNTQVVGEGFADLFEMKDVFGLMLSQSTIVINQSAAIDISFSTNFAFSNLTVANQTMNGRFPAGSHRANVTVRNDGSPLELWIDNELFHVLEPRAYLSLKAFAVTAIGSTLPHHRGAVRVGFSVTKRVLATRLVLEAPYGFRFNANCLVGFKSGIDVNKCGGAVNRATFDLEVSEFASDTKYEFEIAVMNAGVANEDLWRLILHTVQGEVFAGEDESFAIATLKVIEIDNAISRDETSSPIFVISPSVTFGYSGEALLVTVPQSGYMYSTTCPLKLTERPNDAFQPGIDFACTHNASVATITFTGTKQIHPSSAYILQLVVESPKFGSGDGMWILHSVSANGAILEETTVVQPTMVSRLKNFDLVTNASQVFGGDTVKATVKFVTSKRTDRGDSFVVNFPLGYEVDCGFVEWMQSPAEIEISCLHASLTINVHGPDSFLPASSLFELSVAVPTPSRLPERNRAVLSHVRSGVVLARSTIPAFIIVGRMRNVSAACVGDRVAAGSLSSVNVTFVAIANADQLVLIGKGFDFTNSTTGTGHIVSRGSDTLVIETVIAADAFVSLVIEDVRLPLVGGMAEFELQTHSVGDDVRGFANFFVPSRASVVSFNVSRAPSDGMPVRFGDSSAIVNLEIVAPFSLGAVVSVTIDRFAVHEILLVSVGVAEAAGRDEILISVGQRAGDRIRLIARTTPPATGPSGIAIKVRVLSPSLVSTNDVEMVESGIVNPLTVSLSATRHAAPNSLLSVKVSVESGDETSEIILTAPDTFSFPQSDPCPEIHKNVSSCRAVTVNSLLISLREVGAVIVDLQLAAKAPRIPIIEYGWIVTARSADGTTVGWNGVEGFPMEPLMDARILYPALPFAQVPYRVQIAIGFRLTYSSPLSRMLRVRMTNKFRLDGDLEVFNLPIESSRVVVEDAYSVLEVMLNDTMTDGDYALSLFVTPPAMTPEDREVSIELRDETGNVQDAVYSLRIPETRYGVPIVPTRANAQFTRDDQSSVANEIANLTTQEFSLIQLAQLSAFREWVELKIVDIIRFTEIDSISIKFPVGIVTNLAWIMKDLTRTGVTVSENIEPYVQSVTVSTGDLAISLNTNWTRNVSESFFVSFSVVLPQNDPLPAFNFFTVSLVSNGTNLVDYVFRGHSLGDIPQPVELLISKSTDSTSYAAPRTLTLSLLLALCLIH